MRIAYITPYQGPALKERRPITLNRSLAGSSKMETLARLLTAEPLVDEPAQLVEQEQRHRHQHDAQE